MKASVILLSKIFSAFPRNFGGSFNSFYHINCCPENPGSASSPGVWHVDSPVRSRRPLTSKLISFFLFPLTKKKATSVFRVIANHSASFSFLHPVRRFVRTTICPYTHFFNHPVTECKHLLAFILIWICYFGRKELTYISIPLFNG